MTLALLPGGRWPQQLTSLFRARLIETFQNAGLARSIDGGARDRRLRARHRHPRLRTRRGDLRGPCRGRRQDRGADQRPHRRRRDLFRPRAGPLDRRRLGRRLARRGLGGRHDPDRPVRRAPAVMKDRGSRVDGRDIAKRYQACPNTFGSLPPLTHGVVEARSVSRRKKDFPSKHCTEKWMIKDVVSTPVGPPSFATS